MELAEAQLGGSGPNTSTSVTCTWDLKGCVVGDVAGRRQRFRAPFGGTQAAAFLLDPPTTPSANLPQPLNDVQGALLHYSTSSKHQTPVSQR